MKRQVCSILFLLILVLPTVVTYTYFQYRRKEIKREVKLQLANLNFDDLVLLRFSNHELDAKVRWKHSKEFEFEGKMFDIIQLKKSKDSISFWCWLDKQETELNNKLNTLLVEVCRMDIPMQKQKLSFYQFYKSLYFLETKDLNLFNFQSIHNEEIYFSSNLYKFLAEKSLFRPPNNFSC